MVSDMENEKIIPKFDYHTLDEVLTYFKLENVFDDFMKICLHAPKDI